MAHAIWPASLPPPTADSTAHYQGPNNVNETSMDVGPPKLARTADVDVEPFDCTLRLNRAQLATLKTFYFTSLSQVDPFDWIDFTSGDSATYQFTAKGYSAQYIQGQVDRWSVTLHLRRIP